MDVSVALNQPGFLPGSVGLIECPSANPE